jgi:serine protease Do
MKKLRKYLVLASVALVILVSVLGGAISDRLFGYRVLDRFFPRQEQGFRLPTESQRILNEESVVIDVAEKVSPSVVTIGISKTQAVMEFPQSPFEFFFGTPQQGTQEQKIEQDIASGFIITDDGLVVTNKHVVADTQAKYRVITKDDKTYDVQKIYRDPANDIAILKIGASGLSPVELGDSSNLKVGQFVIAIGTALGEFRHTVTTGVISGLGRGITAGSPLEGYVEELDNVIQTDAAINPGNSGGPLLNSAGQVIGINVAVASQGQNIGFALPISIVKDSINNFNQTGQFSRPFLGIRYQMISREAALMNEVPEGAYVAEVVADSPAEKAGIKAGDIITYLDGQKLADVEGGLATIVAKKKVGDSISITLWRDGEEMKTSAFLVETEG